MKKEVLKSLALKAKNRMIHKGQSLDIDSEVNVKVISSDDETFERKVRALLQDDQDMVNPIKKLMDETLLLRLDARGREKYLLETVDKYHAIRKRIEREQTYDYNYQI